MPEGTPEQSDASHAADGLLQASYEGPIDTFELTPPPSEIRLKVLPAADGCWVLTWVASGDRQPVARWLEETHRFEVVRRPAARRRLLVSSCRAPPTPVHLLIDRFDRFDLQVSPDGKARLLVKTRRQDVDAITTLVGDAVPDLRLAGVEPVDQSAHDGVLTRRQHDALTQALASGYFDVPRQIRLADLAQDMSMSQSSLSELLRRAQRRLVEEYIDSTPEPGVRLDADQTPWFSRGRDPRAWTRSPEKDT